MVAVEAFGGEQEHAEFAAIQSPRVGRMDLWSSDVLGWVGCDDPVDVCESSEYHAPAQLSCEAGAAENGHDRHSALTPGPSAGDRGQY